MNHSDANAFESATIILPVMNETTSLDETVEIILRDAKEQDPGRS